MMNIESNSKRILWIDFCKFIAIFYVVWGHSGVSLSLDKYIHTFHMPIFFFMSGYVFNISKINSTKEFLIKKIRTLIVPYFAFSLIVYYIWWMLYKIFNKPMPIRQLTLYKGIFTINPIISPFGGVQWFLTCLFFVEIAFYFIMKIFKPTKREILLILIILSLIGYLYSISIKVRLFWGLDIALTAIVFYGIGYLIANSQNGRLFNMINSANPILIILLLILSIVSTHINKPVNMRTIEYGNYLLFYIAAFGSVFMYIMICIRICRSKKITNSRLFKWLLYIGRNTIVILVLNQLFIQLLNKFVSHFNISIQNININLYGIICSIIVLILMIPASEILNKFMPAIIGKRSIKRCIPKTVEN